MCLRERNFEIPQAFNPRFLKCWHSLINVPSGTRRPNSRATISKDASSSPCRLGEVPSFVTLVRTMKIYRGLSPLSCWHVILLIKAVTRMPSSTMLNIRFPIPILPFRPGVGYYWQDIEDRIPSSSQSPGPWTSWKKPNGMAACSYRHRKPCDRL